MLVANAIAEVLKREKVKFIIGYPVNPIIEAAAEADIRTINHKPFQNMNDNKYMGWNNVCNLQTHLKTTPLAATTTSMS